MVFIFLLDHISIVSYTIRLPDKTVAKLQKLVEKPKPTENLLIAVVYAQWNMTAKSPDLAESLHGTEWSPMGYRNVGLLLFQLERASEFEVLPSRSFGCPTGK